MPDTLTTAPPAPPDPVYLAWWTAVLSLADRKGK